MATLKYQERFKTIKGVFDEFTHRNIFELVSRNYFDEILRPLYIGKESNVFLAKKGQAVVIIKIYRLQNADFMGMYNYIKQDSRYEYLKKHRRDIIFAWTQREYKNLIKAHEAKVRVPEPLAIMHNILIEEFIGDQENPALRLKDLPPKNKKRFFADLLLQIRQLYQAGLVHGDLSAFNILNHNEKPVLIDFSQGTTTNNPNHTELLKRDIKNILHFFAKLGIKANEEEIFKTITAKSNKKE